MTYVFVYSLRMLYNLILQISARDIMHVQQIHDYTYKYACTNSYTINHVLMHTHTHTHIHYHAHTDIHIHKSTALYYWLCREQYRFVHIKINVCVYCVLSLSFDRRLGLGLYGQALHERRPNMQVNFIYYSFGYWLLQSDNINLFC